MKNSIAKILALGLLAFATACGNASTSQDNIEILSSTSLPFLNTFITSGSYSVNQPFSDANPYWIINSGGFGNYQSPARGVVSDVGSSSIIPNTFYVSIIHSARVMTKVHGIQSSLSVRSGDVVNAQTVVAPFFNATTVAFQVFVDGISVCPLSYMSSTFRNTLFGGGLILCQ